VTLRDLLAVAVLGGVLLSPYAASASTTSNRPATTSSTKLAVYDDGSQALLVPGSCSLEGRVATATGSFVEGFAPAYYSRIGDGILLYVFENGAAPSRPSAKGTMIGSFPPEKPFIFAAHAANRTWTVHETLLALDPGHMSCFLRVQQVTVGTGGPAGA
jgi:hypothetical protein